MYETREFGFDGKKYEVRIASDGHTTRIRTFLNGKPANGYTYSVDLITASEIKESLLSVDPVEELVKTAISDVKEKTWDRYLEAVKQLKENENT